MRVTNNAEINEITNGNHEDIAVISSSIENSFIENIRKESYDYIELIDELITKMIEFAVVSPNLIVEYNQSLDTAKKIIMDITNNYQIIIDDVTAKTYFESLKSIIIKIHRTFENTSTNNIKGHYDEFKERLAEEFGPLRETIFGYQKTLATEQAKKNIIKKRRLLITPDLDKNSDIKKADKIINDIIYKKDKYDQNFRDLEDQLKKIKDISDNDLKTVADEISKGNASISRMKLATSFAERGTDLDNDCEKWLTYTIKIIIIFILFSIYLSYKAPLISDINFDTLNIYIRYSIFHAPIFIGLFWGLWFCSKQYSYSCKLRDDYHYKSDLSTAFYGYNEEAAKLAGDDKEIRLALLDIVIKNIGKNPIDPNSPEYHSPYAEILSKCMPVFKKAKDDAKSTKDIVS